MTETKYIFPKQLQSMEVLAFMLNEILADCWSDERSNG